MEFSAQLHTPTALLPEKEPAVPIQLGTEWALEPISTLWTKEISVAYAFIQSKISCFFAPKLVTMSPKLLSPEGMIISYSVSKSFYCLFIGGLNSKLGECMELLRADL
jgi:hypothetical protein